MCLCQASDTHTNSLPSVSSPHTLDSQPTWASTRNVWSFTTKTNPRLPAAAVASFPPLPSPLQREEAAPEHTNPRHSPCVRPPQSPGAPSDTRAQVLCFWPESWRISSNTSRVKMSMNDAHYLTRATVYNWEVSMGHIPGLVQLPDVDATRWH